MSTVADGSIEVKDKRSRGFAGLLQKWHQANDIHGLMKRQVRLLVIERNMRRRAESALREVVRTMDDPDLSPGIVDMAATALRLNEEMRSTAEQ